MTRRYFGTYSEVNPILPAVGPRVWLYANLDKTGEKKCIPPGSARKITGDDLKMAMILRIGAKGGCP
ncbi:hypothetical protein ACFW1F_14825 [Streptomyces bungoensis]|uniref:hypothetical protein n=1 Tax=Streptomyces bungoensis TaxID=285568 RepID=UPI0036BFDB64